MVVGCSSIAENEIVLYDYVNDRLTPSIICNEHYDALLEGNLETKRELLA
jgi:hypothetical protein